MTWLSTVIDSSDLRDIHHLLSLLGLLLSAIAVSTTFPCRSKLINKAYKVGYVLLGLSFAWSFFYADAREWQPWPPQLIMMGAINYLMFMRFVRHRLRLGNDEGRSFRRGKQL